MQNMVSSIRFLRAFSRNKIAVVAAIVVALVILMAIFAPLFAPQDPYDLSSLVLRDGRRPPGYVGAGGYTHILGTDAQGRDLFSAILYGLRISLQMGLLAGSIAFTIGATVGCTAAYVGGQPPAHLATQRFWPAQRFRPDPLCRKVRRGLAAQPLVSR